MGGVSAVLAALLAGCATDAVTGRGTANFYTMSDEIALGRSAMKENIEQLRKQGVRINADAPRLAQMREIANRIGAVSDLPQIRYEVTLAHTNIVNAAALPGGQMIVFEGLYDPKEGLVTDTDELAAVIGHEIAHVNCRHSTERLTKLMLAGAVTETIATVADHGNREEWAQLLRGVFAVGTALWIPSYTRTDEAEADRVGLFYMARAGYDPRAAPRVWQRVAGKKHDPNGSSIFATHPSSGDRYRALSKLLPYAMEDYARATGRYPPGYAPPAHLPPADWRKGPIP